MDRSVQIILSMRDAASRGFQKTGMAIDAVKSKIFSLQSLLMGLAGGYGIKSIGESFLETANQVEGFYMQLETATGSMTKAKAAFSWAEKFAQVTPFDTAPVVQAVTTLLNIGETKAQQVIAAIGDTAMATKKDINDVVSAYVSGETEVWRRMGVEIDRSSKDWKVKVKGMVFHATNNMQGLRDAILKAMQSAFGGGMERAKKTWDGALAEMRSLWWKLQKDIMGSGDDNGPFARIRDRIMEIRDRWAAWVESDSYKQFIDDVRSRIVSAIDIITGAIDTIGKYASIVNTFLNEWDARFERISQKTRDLYPWIERIADMLPKIFGFTVEPGTGGGGGWGDAPFPVVTDPPPDDPAADKAKKKWEEALAAVRKLHQEYSLVTADMPKFSEMLGLDDMRDKIKYGFASVSDYIPLLGKWKSQLEPFSDEWKLVTDALMEFTEMGKKAQDQVKSLGETIREQLSQKIKDIPNTLADAFAGAIAYGQSLSESLISLAQDIMYTVVRAWLLKSIFGSLSGGSVLSSLAGLTAVGGAGVHAGMRATGGPVTANQPYWVGEKRRAELFVPSQSGTVLNSMGGANVEVNVINNTGQQFNVKQSSHRDAVKTVIDLVLEGINSNVSGSKYLLKGAS